MSEKTEKFLKDFKARGIEAQNWPKLFDALSKAEKQPFISTHQSLELATVDLDIDLRAIFAILDKYFEAHLQSDKVVEGVLKDIQNTTDRIATSLESGVVPTIQKLIDHRKG